MSEQGSTALFDLVFEGPSNDSLQTIQKIKGILLAHLELPIPEIQKILESAPTIIKSSNQENDLKQAYHLLKNAGAKVLLVRKAGSAESEETTESSEDGFTFEMPLEPDQPEEPKPTKVYSLDMDEESVEQALDSLIQDTPASLESASEAPETEDVPTMTLEPVVEAPVAIEPPPASPPPAAPLVEENSLLLALDETMSKLDQVLETEPEPSPTAPPAEISAKESSLFLAMDETMSKVEQALETETAPAVTSSPHIEPPKQESSLALSFDDAQTEKTPPAPPPSNSPLKSEDSISLEIKFDDDRSDSPPMKVEELESVARPEDSRVQEIVAPEAPKTETPPPPQPVEVKSEPERAPPAVMDIAPTPAPTLKESFSTPAKAKAKNTDEKTPKPLPEPEEAPAPPRKRFNYLRKVPVDVALPVLVGAGILISANLYYFSQNNPENKPNTDFLLEDPIAEIEKKNASKENEKPVEAPIIFNTEDVAEKYKVVASIVTKEKTLPALTLTISTPALPELTKEEIVQGKIQEPWLRRLESAELMLKPQEGVSILRADGSAMAYIEHKDTQTRLIGSVFVTAQQSEDKNSYAITVQIKSPGADNLKDNSIGIETVEDGFQFFYSGKHTLKISQPKQSAKPPSS